MSSVAQVAIHASQFPERVRSELIESVRTRRVNHKFHYDSVKQTGKWLALHQAYSPSRRDPACAAAYNEGFAAAAAAAARPRVHVVGLGCGGGQKDARLLGLLQGAGKIVSYTPSDVSVAMVLEARRAALALLPEAACRPFVCDLATAADLEVVLDGLIPPDAARLFTFFGMIPNFDPGQFLPQLAALVRPGDVLLLSANLAPGSDYAAGVRQVLPLYDNPLTRDWLLTFLDDLGLERANGEVRVAVEPDPANDLLRIVADFWFCTACAIEVGSERFEFRPGDVLRLFFSYRHTPARLRALLARHRLEVSGEWITPSQEEGVFLASRSPPLAASR